MVSVKTMTPTTRMISIKLMRRKQMARRIGGRVGGWGREGDGGRGNWIVE